MHVVATLLRSFIATTRASERCLPRSPPWSARGHSSAETVFAQGILFRLTKIQQALTLLYSGLMEQLVIRIFETREQANRQFARSASPTALRSHSETHESCLSVLGAPFCPERLWRYLKPRMFESGSSVGARRYLA